MSGDKTISMDEVMNEDRFNLARLYDSQHDDNDPDVNYPVINNDSEMCGYYEPENMADHLKDGFLLENKQAQSYLHLNCRGLSANWEKFHDFFM